MHALLAAMRYWVAIIVDAELTNCISIVERGSLSAIPMHVRDGWEQLAKTHLTSRFSCNC